MRVIIVVLFCILCEVISVPKRPPCPTLQLKHGRVRYRTRNRFVKFMCNPGYILAGEKYSTCENGAWDGPPPKCVRPSCVKVQAPPNIIIYPSHRGGVLNFFCKPGFALRGDNITYCDGNNWDNRLPTCIESSKSPSLSCDFENVDLCGWNHDLVHDFDWKQKNFKTRTGHQQTGPSYDHTKGADGDGYYMYIESSSRNENDTARLISPIYDKINDSNVCFEFYYHMYGSTTGQLRVYLKKLSDSWKLNPNTAFFWKIGNYGNVWIRSWHDLGVIDEDFQIIIEGVRGKSYYNDIAIDDVRIIPDCVDTVTTERDNLYSFDDDTIPSCLNRCDTPPNPNVYSCDCDESCVDNSTCCVDYIAICLLSGTEEYYTTTDLTVSASQSTEIDITTKLATTIKTTQKQKTSNIPTITRKLATTKRLVTTRRPTTTTKPSTRKPTTTRATTTTKATSTRATTTRPKTQRSTLKSLFDDIVTIPQVSEESEIEEIITFAVTSKSLNTLEPVKLATIDETRSGTNSIVIIVCVVILIIGVVSLVIGIMRYRLSCRNLKKMKSSHGDSQSDVRFLTSDEVLNFNLAYVDD